MARFIDMKERERRERVGNGCVIEGREEVDYGRICSRKLNSYRWMEVWMDGPAQGKEREREREAREV
jgi:hypothetical protein